jgi:hypothetical protein
VLPALAGAGVYAWTRGADTLGVIGVAIGADEPLLARASATDIVATFSGANRTVVSDDVSGFLRSVRQSGASRPLALPLLALALLAALAEAWLAGRYRPRAASESSARTA